MLGFRTRKGHAAPKLVLICGFGNGSTSASIPPVAGRSPGPSVADAKAFLHRMCFFLLFNVSTYFCLLFLFLFFVLLLVPVILIHFIIYP